MQFVTIKHDLPPQMTTFIAFIPIQMHFFTLSLFKVYFFAITAGASCNINPDISQSDATIHNGLVIATVYRLFSAIRWGFPLSRIPTNN